MESNPTNPANDGAQGATDTSANQAGGSAGNGQNSGGATSSADGKNWMEFANLQKIVDQLPQGVKDFCTNSWNQASTQVTKMSTTQKVAGAAALVGLGIWAMRAGKSKPESYRGPKHKYRKDSDAGYGSHTSYRSGSASQGGSGYGSTPGYESYADQAQGRTGRGSSDYGYGSGSSAYTGGQSGSAYGRSESGSSAGSANDSVYRGNTGSSATNSRDYDTDL